MRKMRFISGHKRARLLIGILVTGLLLLHASLCFSQCPDQANNAYTYFLRDISIEGSTNLNRFSFRYDAPLFPDGATTKNGITGEYETEIVDFSIPVHSFKGSVPAMQKDFLDLLKASEYPEIIVGIGQDEFNCLTAGIQRERIELIVTLAGKQKAIGADYSAGYDSGDRLVLHGVTKFMLTDFQLEPPEKAMGLVRVQNEVFIKFDIVISNMQLIANQSAK